MVALTSPNSPTSSPKLRLTIIAEIPGPSSSRTTEVMAMLPVNRVAKKRRKTQSNPLLRHAV